MPKARAVIFDIGNVLIEWQPERYFDRIMPAADRARMFAEVDLHAMNEAVDLGAPFRQTIYEMADRYPEWRDKIRLWHDHWIEMATPVIPQSVRLLRALRARGVPVFALTNFGDETFRLAEPHYPFLGEFDRAYVSGRLKLVKPDPRIYELVERDSGVAPGDMLFTDDKPENIAAARHRGWQVHHFEHPEGLAARLVADGLLDEGEAA